MEKHLSISLVEVNSKWALRADGTGGACVVLCVKSEIDGSWILPSGLVGNGESTTEAQERSLGELTGLATAEAEEVYRGIAPWDPDTTVHLFRVTLPAPDLALESISQSNSGLCWMKHTELVEKSGMGAFYDKAFQESW